ncbi:MAG: S8 family serine peptidase [Pseudomonadota bacterium]
MHTFLRMGFVVILSLAAHGCAKLAATTEPSAKNTESPIQLRSRQIIVAFDAVSVRDPRVRADILATRYQIQSGKRFPLSSVGVVCAVFTVPTSVNMQSLLRNIESERGVVLAQRNSEFRNFGKGSQDKYSRLQYGLDFLGARAVHAVATGMDIKVGVVDTGIDSTHADLKGAIAMSKNFVASTGNDKERHGTAVAGVIAARAGNGHGIVGVAPNASLVSARACWYGGPPDGVATCSSWSLARAIDYSIEVGVDVLNLSFGGPRDRLIERVLTEALRRNIIVVAATLPDGDDPGFPAAMPGVIAAVAANSKGKVTVPNWKTALTVSAPGIDVITTIPNGYAIESGTSMAAAHISGVLALWRSIAPASPTPRILDLLSRSPMGTTDIKQIDACRGARALSRNRGDGTVLQCE